MTPRNTTKNIIPELESSVILNITTGGPFDMGSINDKKLIKFYGTYWHQDPRFYKPSDKLKTKPAEQIWLHDEKKRNCAKELGYDVYIIWESDWYKSSQPIIDEIKSWWYNGN